MSTSKNHIETNGDIHKLLAQAEEEYAKGNTFRMLKGETLSNFIARTANV